MPICDGGLRLKRFAKDSPFLLLRRGKGRQGHRSNQLHMHRFAKGPTHSNALQCARGLPSAVPPQLCDSLPHGHTSHNGPSGLITVEGRRLSVHGCWWAQLSRVARQLSSARVQLPTRPGVLRTARLLRPPGAFTFIRATPLARALVHIRGLDLGWGWGGTGGLEKYQKRGRGGGSGAQNFVYQKWPDQIFPIVNFVFSHDGPFGLGGGGVQGWGWHKVRGGGVPSLLRWCTAILVLPLGGGVGSKGTHRPSLPAPPAPPT